MPRARPEYPDSGLTEAVPRRGRPPGTSRRELELIALQGVLYGLQRLGLRFVESPRHADVLLCTGPLTRNLREALERTWAATPDPKWVVAVGDCAVDGGVFRGSYAVEGGTAEAVPVDLVIRGCPPTPGDILAGLSALVTANCPPTRRPVAGGLEQG